MKSLTWVSKIKQSDKNMLENYISLINENKVEPDKSGGFAYVYFCEDYVIKSNINFQSDIFYEYDSDNNQYDIILDFNSDEEVLKDIHHIPNYTTLYAYNNTYIIMERVKGIDLSDYYLKEASLPKDFRNDLKKIFLETAENNWIPYDIRLTDIFLQDDGQYKVIDVNLFQRKSIYSEIIEEKGVHNLIDEYIEDILEADLNYLDSIRQYVS